MISAMEWFILTVLVLISLGDASVIPTASSRASVEDGTPQLECLAGSEWESNCHYCRCSDSGVAECLKQSSCDDGVFIPKKASSFLVATDLPAGVECAAGSTWRSGCNVCVCSTEGFRVCSQNLCKDEEKKPEKHCAPDTAWINDCNRCYCNEKGFGYCTQIGCIHSETVKDSELPTGKECAAGSAWKSGCNDCVCSEAGYPECSLMVCEEEEEEEREQRCALDTMWMDGCNKCYCNGNSFCTQIDCAPTDVSPGALGKNVPQGEIKAKPKRKKKVYPKEETQPKPNEISHVVLKRSVCKANQEFQDECNSCKCSGDGQTYTCTQNECLESDMTKEVEVFMKSEGVDHIERHSVCKPQDTFFIGCNTCNCNFDGTDFSCTNKPCPLPDDVELFHELNVSSNKTAANRTCVSKAMFIKDCNICWCNDDGTDFFCTRKVCPDLLDLPNEPNVEDVPENPSKLRIIKKECRPNEIFELDCNMCRCNPDGKSFSCTRRACVDPEDKVIEEVSNVDQKDVKVDQVDEVIQDGKIYPETVKVDVYGVKGAEEEVKEKVHQEGEEIYEENKKVFSRKVRATPQELPKACQPGQEFRLDCNKCLCDNEGLSFSCTRIDCVALNTAQANGGTRTKRDSPSDTTEVTSELVEIAMECTPGSVFQRECNSCTCSQSGQNARCAKAKCSQNHVDSDVHATDPGFRCNPGEQFKRDCNDCTCTADGRSTFCTLRFCEDTMRQEFSP